MWWVMWSPIQQHSCSGDILGLRSSSSYGRSLIRRRRISSWRAQPSGLVTQWRPRRLVVRLAAVGQRNVEHQVAVAADDVAHQVHDVFAGLVFLPLLVVPAADAGVGLAGIGQDIEIRRG